MDWNDALRKTIDFLEENLLDENAADSVARAVSISPFYLQKGFRLVTGYTMSEYVRSRRLYLAGLDIISDSGKVIDLAYKYGYDTPESFTKAFSRFHGVSPTQLKNEPSRLRTFLPLKIIISIQGGNSMDYTVEKMDGFKVIGFARDFPPNDPTLVPKFWGEISEKHLDKAYSAEAPNDDISRAVRANKVGEYGICVEDTNGSGSFRYLIAGEYAGGDIPGGMEVYELPPLEWAKFSCKGPMPEAIQALYKRIFGEWLPGNSEFEIAAGFNAELYSSRPDVESPDYESAVWIPVRRKRAALAAPIVDHH